MLLIFIILYISLKIFINAFYLIILHPLNNQSTTITKYRHVSISTTKGDNKTNHMKKKSCFWYNVEKKATGINFFHSCFGFNDIG